MAVGDRSMMGVRLGLNRCRGKTVCRFSPLTDGAVGIACAGTSAVTKSAAERPAIAKRDIVLRRKFTSVNFWESIEVRWRLRSRFKRTFNWGAGGGLWRFADDPNMRELAKYEKD